MKVKSMPVAGVVLPNGMIKWFCSALSECPVTPKRQTRPVRRKLRVERKGVARAS